VPLLLSLKGTQSVQREGGDYSIVSHLDRNSPVVARHGPVVIGIAQKLWRRPIPCWT
jgi:hypothetical protein